MAMSRSLGGTLLTTRSPMAISPRGDAFEPGDHAQQGRFSAARRADQHDEFAIVDVDADAMQDLDRAKRFLDVADFDRCHRSSRTARSATPSEETRHLWRSLRVASPAHQVGSATKPQCKVILMANRAHLRRWARYGAPAGKIGLNRARRIRERRRRDAGPHGCAVSARVSRRDGSRHRLHVGDHGGQELPTRSGGSASCAASPYRAPWRRSCRGCRGSPRRRSTPRMRRAENSLRVSASTTTFMKPWSRPSRRRGRRGSSAACRRGAASPGCACLGLGHADAAERRVDVERVGRSCDR